MNSRRDKIPVFLRFSEMGKAGTHENSPTSPLLERMECSALLYQGLGASPGSEKRNSVSSSAQRIAGIQEKTQTLNNL